MKVDKEWKVERSAELMGNRGRLMAEGEEKKVGGRRRRIK